MPTYFLQLKELRKQSTYIQNIFLCLEYINHEDILLFIWFLALFQITPSSWSVSSSQSSSFSTQESSSGQQKSMWEVNVSTVEQWQVLEANTAGMYSPWRKWVAMWPVFSYFNYPTTLWLCISSSSVTARTATFVFLFITFSIFAL